MGRRNSASDAVTDTTPRPDDAQTWATFEAEALPHADRLFRVAMWFNGIARRPKTSCRTR